MTILCCFCVRFALLWCFSLRVVVVVVASLCCAAFEFASFLFIASLRFSLPWLVLFCLSIGVVVRLY